MIAYLEDRLAAEPEAVPRARHALAVELLPVVGELTLDKILLLATEAVTAALRSTTSPWRLRVDADDRHVRVCVDYEADALATAADAALDGDGSHGDGSDDDGLRAELFEALSSTWGTEDVGPAARSIWFEVPAG